MTESGQRTWCKHAWSIILASPPCVPYAASLTVTPIRIVHRIWRTSAPFRLLGLITVRNSALSQLESSLVSCEIEMIHALTTIHLTLIGRPFKHDLMGNHIGDRQGIRALRAVEPQPRCHTTRTVVEDWSLTAAPALPAAAAEGVRDATDSGAVSWNDTTASYLLLFCL
jgi:hypothetical protein